MASERWLTSGGERAVLRLSGAERAVASERCRTSGGERAVASERRSTSGAEARACGAPGVLKDSLNLIRLLEATPISPDHLFMVPRACGAPGVAGHDAARVVSEREHEGRPHAQPETRQPPVARQHLRPPPAPPTRSRAHARTHTLSRTTEPAASQGG